jgi:hypothetical protein
VHRFTTGNGGEATVQPVWWVTLDGDLACTELYERHYSARKLGAARHCRQIIGPGYKLLLRTERADAIFGWRKFKDDSGQQGVNCAVFRNESPHRSSELIRQADQIADRFWADRRHYTYVDPQEVRSTNPGYCFICAGWRRCGVTPKGLIVLERVHELKAKGDQTTPRIDRQVRGAAGEDS